MQASMSWRPFDVRLFRGLRLLKRDDRIEAMRACEQGDGDPERAGIHQWAPDRLIFPDVAHRYTAGAPAAAALGPGSTRWPTRWRRALRRNCAR